MSYADVLQLTENDNNGIDALVGSGLGCEKFQKKKLKFVQNQRVLILNKFYKNRFELLFTTIENPNPFDKIGQGAFPDF